jgi:hypothetical protein
MQALLARPCGALFRRNSILPCLSRRRRCRRHSARITHFLVCSTTAEASEAKKHSSASAGCRLPGDSAKPGELQAGRQAGRQAQ